MSKLNKKTKILDINKFRSEIIDLKKNLLNLRFQKSSGQLEKTDKIKKTRKKIAKLKTDISNNLGGHNA